jgi:dolichyl-phosphate beta-glucosyltransferase
MTEASGVQLSVVIPAYNEAQRIGRTLDELRTELPRLSPSWEIRVVDDGSRDETPQIVTAAAAQHEGIVLQREPHRGKGGAVRYGLLAARGDLRFMCDADLSMAAADIARFLTIVPSRADIAIATREGAGAHRVGEPEHRHLLGRVFNHLVRATVLTDLSDTQCGFKMFTARAVEAIFPYVTIDGWAFDIEALVIARRRGLRIQEIPIEWHYRDRSQVSPLRDPLLMAKDVLKIRANALRGRYDR